MNRFILTLGTGVLLLCGCRDSAKLSPENTDGTGFFSFSATYAPEDNVKSGLGGSTRRSVLFQANDAIGLYSIKNASGAKFTTAKGTVGTKATFTGTGHKDSRYYAVYPYVSGASFSSGTISGLTVPAVQTATGGTFDPAAAITYASSADTSLRFANLCSLLKVVIDAPADSIVVTVSPGTAAICGPVSISTGSGSLTGTSGSNPKVVLKGTIKEDTEYYIAIVPGTYDAITLTAYSSRDGASYRNAARHKATSSTFVKGRIYNLDTLKAVMGYSSVEKSAGKTGCWWVRLWKGGPKWAEFNLGSTADSYTNATLTDDATRIKYFGDSYFWGNAKPRDATYDSKSSALKRDSTDTAFLLWKNGWRMPSLYDIQKLMATNNCTWTWCDGTKVQYAPGCTVCGFKVSGVGDYSMNHIFLPAVGFWDKNVYKDSNEWIYYWTSDGTPSDLNQAYCLHANEDKPTTATIKSKQTGGFSIRPVRD